MTTKVTTTFERTRSAPISIESHESRLARVARMKSIHEAPDLGQPESRLLSAQRAGGGGMGISRLLGRRFVGTGRCVGGWAQSLVGQ